ncbi:hypothetical protein BXZ70DRAFT_955347 [Cristinia sonorae]|uniref:Amidohydrolase-related domain-containing protein n=1 Tax=Cristinia sonorae TaxID=1940300 RepID=A0A8K0UHA5_9AGAR|nr:hypothetical protein BXZ70DRAFT_955347 [Cristinia sonorae]
MAGLLDYPGSPEKTRDSLLPKLVAKPWIRRDPPDIILQKVLVVDPKSSSVLFGPQDVTLSKGVITAVKPHNTQPAVDDPDTIVADLDGKFVCPGLIDCHVHVSAVPGAKTMRELAETSAELIHLRTTYTLREMLFRGFTTVRDTGGATKALADAVSEGLILGPRLVQCGKALSQTGGHADFTPAHSDTGCCGGHSKFLGRICDGVPEVLRSTREELKAGADFIKVMCGGGVASATDAIETVQFTAEEIQAITTTCRQMGDKHTTAHAYTDSSIRHAIENGIKGIEHGNLMSPETARLMAKKGIYLTPTLACYGIMVRPPFEDFLPPDGQFKNKQVMEKGLDALKIADEAGVTVCYGSDLLTSMHALQTEEFSVRATVLSSPKILQHATTNASQLLKDSRLGRISENAFADVLVLNANPLDDVTILDRPEDHLLAVIKGGRVVSSKIDSLKAETW